MKRYIRMYVPEPFPEQRPNIQRRRSAAHGGGEDEYATRPSRCNSPASFPSG